MGKFPGNKNLFGQVYFLKFSGYVQDISRKISGFFLEVSGFLIHI
jgi:hypothetical protein